MCLVLSLLAVGKDVSTADLSPLFVPEVCYASDLFNFEVLFEIPGFHILNEF